MNKYDVEQIRRVRMNYHASKRTRGFSKIVRVFFLIQRLVPIQLLSDFLRNVLSHTYYNIQNQNPTGLILISRGVYSHGSRGMSGYITASIPEYIFLAIPVYLFSIFMKKSGEYPPFILHRLKISGFSGGFSISALYILGMYKLEAIDRLKRTSQ